MRNRFTADFTTVERIDQLIEDELSKRCTGVQARRDRR
jgi:hypothetical protein